MKNDYEIRGEITAIFLNKKDGTKFETIISTSDLPKVKKLPNKWGLKWDKVLQSYYVKGRTGEKRIEITLHRFIFDNPNGLVVDHINHDTLDNSKGNLRAITQAQNIQNRSGAQKNSKSGVRGISWNKKNQKWFAKLQCNGEQIYLGLFEDIDEAEKAVKKSRKQNMPFSKEGQSA